LRREEIRIIGAKTTPFFFSRKFKIPIMQNISSMVHIAFDIPPSVKREFKVLCAEHEDDMSGILRKAVDNYISSKKMHIVKS